MRKEASGRGKESAPKVAKPAVLSAEAAAMEQKLAELRKAMEKERAKREALMTNAGGGSIWRNGSASGGLRSNVKGKGPGEGSGPSGSGTSSSQRPGSVEAPARQATAAAPRASSARAAGTGADGDVPSVSGSRLTSSRTAMNAGPAEPKGGAVGGSRSAVGCSSSSGGGGAAVAGMSCGTDEGPSLGDGAFNEADSHRSFLDALNEWRKANRGDTTADGRIEAAASAAVVTSSGSGAGSSGPLRPRNSAPPQSSSLEVQTEARPASRPSSAKPLSYFDKLVINASSRVAGHLAAGGSSESLSLRGSLSGQAAGLPRAPSVGVRPQSAGLRPTSAGPTTTTAAATHKASLAAEASTLRSSSTTITTAAAATAGASPGLRTDGSGSKSGAADLLSILDRLEALERERQAASHKEDEDDEDGVAAAIRVTTATGMVLTKGTRLPDEVLMPPNEGR